MANSFQDELTDYIEEKGGKDIWVDKAHAHPQIHFTYRGVRRFLVTPASVSDWRAIENAKSTFNRMLADIENITPDFVDDEEEETSRQGMPIAPLILPETFGGRLRFAREQQQFSRNKLSELSGVDVETIEEYEKTERRDLDDLDATLKLSTALNLSLSYLAGNLAIPKEYSEMSDIGKRVQERRQELNMTLGQVALETGIPVQQLANLETGTYPDFFRIGEVAKALKTTEVELKTGKKPYADINTLKDFGLFLKFLRNKAGMTQRELAEKLGRGPAGGMMTVTEISKAEVGKTISGILSRGVAKLAHVLDYPADELEAIVANLGKAAPQPTRRVVNEATPVGPVTPAAPVPEAIQPVIPQATVDNNIILMAIEAQGELTRNLLVQQHETLIKAISNLPSSNVAATLHSIIDNLFKG